MQLPQFTLRFLFKVTSLASLCIAFLVSLPTGLPPLFVALGISVTSGWLVGSLFGTGREGPLVGMLLGQLVFFLAIVFWFRG